MVMWVVDKGALKLRDQVDEAAPNRSKASDGTIGDLIHAQGDSDHNPESPPPAGNPDNQVDALDLTHDPDHGADMGVVTESIRVSKDPRIDYVIFNHRIYSGSQGPQPWVWRPYTGTSDPHTNHAHFSMLDHPHDVTTPWSIGIPVTTAEDVWKVDGIPAVTGEYANGDIATNKFWQAGYALGEAAKGARNAAGDTKKVLTAMAAMDAKLDLILTKLADLEGPAAPTEPAGDALTPDQLAAALRVAADQLSS